MDFYVKSDVKPTLLNKDMAIGALVGDVVGGVMGGLAGMVGGPAGMAAGILAGRAAGVLIGGWAGGAHGKQHMEAEAVNGKKVPAPSKFNKDTLLGGLLGFVVGGALTGLAVKALLITTPLSVPLAIGALSLLAIGTIGSAIAGLAIGSKHGEAQMAKDYDGALQQYVQQKSRAQAPSQNVAVDNAASKNFAARLEQERQQLALAASHEATR